jgi:hypothetical protein
MNNLDNKRYIKNFIIIRLIATLVVLLSLILPYFGLMKHSRTPYIILVTLSI